MIIFKNHIKYFTDYEEYAKTILNFFHYYYEKLLSIEVKIENSKFESQIFDYFSILKIKTQTSLNYTIFYKYKIDEIFFSLM